jgi:phosphate transport system substrate-binding protein
MRTLAITAFLLALCASLCAEDLPDYEPQMRVTGVLRSSGSAEMGPLMKLWEAGFKRVHPDVQFADNLKSSATAMYGLDMRTADLALMGRPVFPYERYGVYERSWVYPAFVEVATGSAERLHKSPAYAIFVHKDNPLAKISVRELDGVFGAQRAGGWNALSWDTKVARTPKDDIRTWGTLGLVGDWARKPIHPYGKPRLGAGAITYFQARVMGGGELFNEELREYAEPARMIAELGRDPLGIAYAPIAFATPQVRAIAVSETPAGPYVPLTRASVGDRSYPLHRPVYIYYTIDDAKTDIAPARGDPRAKEFLRYILSRQGQADVTREGSYLPLTAPVVREQLRKLDSTAMPQEHELMEE